MKGAPLVPSWLMLRFAFGLLVAVGAAELAARATVDADRVLWWHEPAAQIKVADLDGRGHVDTIIVGTSMAQQALIPSVLADAWAVADEPPTVFNAGINGGVPVVTERWILDQVLPRSTPTTVIWAVSSLDLSATYGTATKTAYDQARATRSGSLARADRSFGSASRLVRARSLLRDPAALWGSGATNDVQRWAAARAEVGTDGERLAYSLDLSAERANEVLGRIHPFELDQADLIAMIRTIDALTTAGVDVVVVELPVPPRLLDLHPDGPADRRRFQQAMTQLTAAVGVDYVTLGDLGVAEVDADFVDFTHLDAPAARRFSVLVGDRLASRQP